MALQAQPQVRALSPRRLASELSQEASGQDMGLPSPGTAKAAGPHSRPLPGWVGLLLLAETGKCGARNCPQPCGKCSVHIFSHANHLETTEYVIIMFFA